MDLEEKLRRLNQELAETETSIKYYGGIGRRRPELKSFGAGGSGITSGRPDFDKITDSFKWDWALASGDRDMELQVRKVYIDALTYGHRGYKNKEAASREVDRWIRRLEEEEVR